MLQGVMRDKISSLPVEQHFLKLKTLPSSSNFSPRKESKTRQADIEFYRSQKHVSLTCNTYLFSSKLLTLKH